MGIRRNITQAMRALSREFITLNRVEISRAALLHNFDIFQKLSPKSQVIPVLKANAYGHGLEQVAETLQVRDLPYLAVDGYFEALRIREVSRQPTLVMGAIHPDNFAHMKYKDFAFLVHDETTIIALGKTGRNIPIHIELETGMMRHGVQPNTLPAILQLLKRYPNLAVEGVMSHLADSDNPDTTFTDEQVRRFDLMVQQIIEAGFWPHIIHLGQTAGSTKVRSKYATAVRVGIGLYGVNPLQKTDTGYAWLKGLRPALKIITTITKIVPVPAGESVSYGRTFTAPRDMKIGILPIGYYEGLPRALGNQGQVIWHDTPLPLVGRVNMNHCMVDLSKTTAKIGDEVQVLGGTTGQCTSVDHLSKTFDLFPYSLLTGVNENLRRIIT